ncbi:hypothetical protein BOX15_Mlig012357g1 [Macrostomum lignano]|uniref:SAC3/GANP/THP3 conserved domain-containing protein n=1 Tax=Macrostomum lignano TaxID=282301 RepID=A0A267GPX6_9PLAT|nr:hypothetical protein BOX15_Mlig012357g1 [Macrostomum lignano]
MQPGGLFNLGGTSGSLFSSAVAATGSSGGGSLFSSASATTTTGSTGVGGGSLFSSASTGGGGLFSSAAGGGSSGGLFAGFSSTAQQGASGFAFEPDSNSDEGEADGASAQPPGQDGANREEETDSDGNQMQSGEDQEAEQEYDNDGDDGQDDEEAQDIEEDNSSAKSATEGDEAEDNEDEDTEKDTEDSNGNSASEGSGGSSSSKQAAEPRRLAIKRPADRVQLDQINEDRTEETDFVGDLRQRIKISRRTSGSETAQQQPQQSSTSIVLRNLPAELNADEPLRRLFKGVIRVYANCAKCQAILHFDSAAAVDAAIEKASSARLRIRCPNLEAFRRRLPGGGSATAAPAAVSAPAQAPTISASSLALPASQSLADRIRVLESVERQLRVKLGKSGAAVSATCQDMCPEKERYLREDRHRVHSFEAAPGRPGVMDPARAVKEYSRSAADQEAPLPHELRPLPVLQRTLLYLSTCIADIGDREGRWQEWYEFLWDRTRAIRKEVTQQRLCSPGAAELVERCARFHVYAGARMVGMPADVFDEKINNENLTKCLQTLRELYSDLSGQCPNESEFRAYMILMKLNDPNVLDEVHQLSADVRASPQVRLALRAFFALSSNNYVAFFRAVHRAEFLSACLLLRYFTQARIAALRTMSYALRPPPSAGQRLRLPLGRLPLGFEDADDAASFCKFMGFECDYETSADEPAVWLERAVASAFDPTESRSVRAIRVVESKRGNRSVGECLWGGPLPELRLPEPSVSFDERGRYIGDLSLSRGATPPPPPPRSKTLTAAVLPTLTSTSSTQPAAAAPFSQAAPIFPSSSTSLFSQTAAAGAAAALFPTAVSKAPTPQPPVLDDKLIVSLSDEIVSSALPPLLHSVAADVLDGARALSNAVADAYADTFNGATRDLCAEIASEMLAETRSHTTAISDVADCLIGEVIHEAIRRESQELLDRSLVESLDTVIFDALIFEESELACRQFVAEKSTRCSLDSSLILEHRNRRLRLVWDSWRRLSVTKAASRARLSDMAPCAPLVDPFQLVDRLHGRQPPDVSVARLPRASADPSPAAAAALAAAAAVSRPIPLPDTCRLALLLSPDCPAAAASWLRLKLAPALVADTAEAAEAAAATHCIADVSVLGSEAHLALLHLPTLGFACTPESNSNRVATVGTVRLRLLGGRPTPIWHRDLLLGLRWLLDQPTLPPYRLRQSTAPNLASAVESLLLDAYFRPLASLAERCDAAGQPQPPLRCLIQLYNACIVALGPLASPAAVAELRLPDAPLPPPPACATSAWRVNQEAIAWLLSAYPPACPLAGAAAALSANRPVSRFPWARLAARLADRRLSARLSADIWQRTPAGSTAPVRAELARLDVDDFLPEHFYQQWLLQESPARAEAEAPSSQRYVVWRPPPPKPSPQLSELAMAMEKLRQRLHEAQAESRMTAQLLRESF